MSPEVFDLPVIKTYFNLTNQSHRNNGTDKDINKIVFKSTSFIVGRRCPDI